MSSRSDLTASLVTFHVRLWLGGLFIATLVPVSIAAAALNFVSGAGPDDGPYGHVHPRAVAFDVWLKSLGRPTARQTTQRPEAAGSEAPVVVRESAPERRAPASA